MGRQIRVRAVVLAVSVLLAAGGCSGSGTKTADPKASAPPPSSAPPTTSPGSSAAASPTASVPAGDAKPGGGDVLPGMVGVAVARTQLAGLEVAPPGTMAGYSRAKFTHWAEQGDKCDTREVVLERDGKDVARDAECRAVSGTWRSLYDGVVVTDASKMDIDHVVPLAEGWRSGASAWDAARRKAFANDLTHPQLLAVTAATNRSKGDQSPDLWQPPDKSSWCQYGRAWTTVKSTYGLTVTEAEKRMLTTMLDTCAA
ncbi:HNH endonuclease family protein [Streptomyces sp. NPDC046876]|uniref:HNH endonuclease family protein n=1 Tax=Streptomyces sp. NPDC046876 TaxID=3155616 RepID=UPI0033DCEE73